MGAFFRHWFTVTLALAVTVWVLPGVQMEGVAPLLIGGLVLGLVNATVRPVLFVLTLPVSVLTLGLFYLVVNGTAFWLASVLVPGFTVSSPLAAVAGALLVSLVSWFVAPRGKHRRRED